MFLQADHTSVVKAVYDYEAGAPGELSVKEDELLFVFDTEDEWLLVQSQVDGGKAGFVPGNYVEVWTALYSSFLHLYVIYSPPAKVAQVILRQLRHFHRLLFLLRYAFLFFL